MHVLSRGESVKVPANAMSDHAFHADAFLMFLPSLSRRASLIMSLSRGAKQRSAYSGDTSLEFEGQLTHTMTTNQRSLIRQMRGAQARLQRKIRVGKEGPTLLSERNRSERSAREKEKCDVPGILLDRPLCRSRSTPARKELL